MVRTPPLSEAWLLADYTGVGRAVMRLILSKLTACQVPRSWTAVLLNAGHNASNPVTGELVLAKTDLIGTLQVLLQTRRLQIASELSDARLLVRELEHYRPKVVLPTTEMLQWRDGQHDDLILAVALAAWGGEYALRREGRPDQLFAWSR
jgi:hypothetical protein